MRQVWARLAQGRAAMRQQLFPYTTLFRSGVSLRVCGAADPSQGPWEPGALRAALSLGGQATAGGALH